MLFTIAASPVLHAEGVSFQAISLGWGLVYAALAVGEIPTGAWADVFGPKKAAILGGLLQAVALAIMGVPSRLTWPLLGAFLLYGIGSSFISGALSGFLYASTKNQEGSAFNSSRYFSLTEKSAIASYIAASLSVGFLSEWMGRGAFLVAAAFSFISVCAIVVWFGELSSAGTASDTPAGGVGVSSRGGLIGGLKMQELAIRVREGFSFISSSGELKTLLPIRMLHQAETILGVLWLPWIRELGGGDARWFSILTTGSYVLRYLTNHFAARWPKPESYGSRMATSLLIMAIGSVTCIYATNVWSGMFGLWIVAGARGPFLPAVQAVQHDAFPERVRVTGLSLMNCATEIMIAASYFAGSLIMDRISVYQAWVISAVSFLAAAGLAMRLGMVRGREAAVRVGE